MSAPDTSTGGRWFERQRREWITETLHVFGYINRDHLIRKFSISSAQASIDVNRYLKLRPNSMLYNSSLKRYERNDSHYGKKNDY